MESMRAHIQADIVSIRESVARYRKLAEERKAHGDHAIAGKLVELVANLEAKVDRLEAVTMLEMTE
jgi:hypothetical protein